MDATHGTTLLDCLRNLPDPRCRRGRRYEWEFLVTAVVAAMVHDCQGVRAMAEWVEFHGEELQQWLGVRVRRMPSLTTLQRVVAMLDVEELRTRLRGFAEELLAEFEAVEEQVRGWSMDGKSARGARHHGPEVRVVSLLDQSTGIPVDQVVVGEGGEEIGGGQALVAAQRDLGGVVVTADALHCQRRTAKLILARGGHYLVSVGDNQPTLRAAIEGVFTTAPTRSWSPIADQYEDTDNGHGRYEQRWLETSGEVAWLDWPGAAQVYQRTYRRYDLASGETKTIHEYGITSLPVELADAATVARLRRAHWRIENSLHWVKDVVLREDACQVGRHRGGAALALLRNMLVAVLRVSGRGGPARARRYAKSSMERTLRLVGAI